MRSRDGASASNPSEVWGAHREQGGCCTPTAHPWPGPHPWELCNLLLPTREPSSESWPHFAVLVLSPALRGERVELGRMLRNGAQRCLWQAQDGSTGTTAQHPLLRIHCSAHHSSAPSAQHPVFIPGSCLWSCPFPSHTPPSTQIPWEQGLPLPTCTHPGVHHAGGTG